MKNKFQFFALAFMMTGAAAFSQTTGAGERIERVTLEIPPAWIESSGVRIEVSGSYTATGDASVLMRLSEEKQPFILTWQSFDGFQMGSGLPRDVAELEGERPREPQTVAWRLIIRLKRGAQHVKLEILNAGAWQKALEKDVVLTGLRE